ncbi:hypothetical protein CR513_05300, partial [Mucuna pruriens]
MLPYMSKGNHDEGYISVHNVSYRSQGSEMHERHGRNRRVKGKPRRDEIDGIKCKIPPFLEDYKLDYYLSWKMKEDKEANLLVMGLIEEDYEGKSKSVEEYHKEIEMDLMKAQLVESRGVTMAKFLHGPNREIRDIVELRCYTTLEEKPYHSDNRRGKEKGSPRNDKRPKKGSEP